MEENTEQDNLLDMVFPVGEERWIKVKYLNLEKCIKAFKLSNYTKPENDKKIGYKVTAIGIREEYIPQVAALIEIKDELLNLLNGVFEDIDDYRFVAIRNLFKSKIEEISKRTIRTK